MLLLMHRSPILSFPLKISGLLNHQPSILLQLRSCICNSPVTSDVNCLLTSGPRAHSNFRKKRRHSEGGKWNPWSYLKFQRNQKLLLFCLKNCKPQELQLPCRSVCHLLDHSICLFYWAFFLKGRVFCWWGHEVFIQNFFWKILSFQELGKILGDFTITYYIFFSSLLFSFLYVCMSFSLM